MRRLSWIIVLAGFLFGPILLSGAWAQTPGREPSCPPGEDCAEVVLWGAWGLIFLGVIFFAVWFVPPRRQSEAGKISIDRIPMMQALQRRIEKELTGWRRFQWPLLGAFFILLGVATLVGWR
jgi:HAMP domain-containing protein